MESTWPIVRLGDVCQKIGSGATPRGGRDVYLADGEISLIRSQNVLNFGFERVGLASISQEHADQLSNVEVQDGDVLLNITGDSVARCWQVPRGILPARVNQHVALIRTKPDKLDSRYLRYVLVNPSMQSYMLALAGGGATRNALTKSMIEDFRLSVPPLPEQRAIAHILGTLDDKIALNRRMNQTLEEIARAIFQSWFIDFDPVRAKATGRHPAGMDAETAALFPDAFVDSELGEIPAEWDVRPLDEIATFLNGLALQKYPLSGNGWLPAIKIAQLRKGDASGADRVDEGVPADYVIGDGDMLFSWSGSLEVRIWCGGPGALNQHLFKVSSAEFPKWFYYHWTLHHLSAFREIAAGKATTMGHVQRRHLSSALAVVPPTHALDVMSGIMEPLLARTITNNMESRTLATIRDTLLPKLLSGELRVPDAERLVEQHL